MNLHEIATLLPMPWRVLVGHILPLVISLACLLSMRSAWKRTWGQFVAATALSGALVYTTSSIVSGFVPGRGYFQAVAMNMAVPVAVASIAVVMRRSAIDARAVFASAFLALYVPDLLLASSILGGWGPRMLTGIGGAGLVDALLVGPFLAVAGATLAASEARFYRAAARVKRALCQ